LMEDAPYFVAGRGTGAQMGSRLSLVFW
jgi:hypothetical protein